MTRDLEQTAAAAQAKEARMAEERTWVEASLDGDNAAFALASARDCLGTVACDMSSGSTLGTADKAKRFALSVPIVAESNIGAIYALLQAAAGYAPASAELFEATLEIEG